MNVDGLAALPLLTDPETLVWSPSAGDRGLGALSTSRGNLPLRRVAVSAHVEGLFVQVEVEQTFANEGDDPLEAVYIFPLPERMALQAMSLQVDDRDVIAQIQERAAARAEYRAAVQEGRPAALVEEDRPGVFTLQVGSIPPGEEATVRTTLVGMIPCTNREATFRFPLVIAPRYVPGIPLPGASVGAGTALDTDAVPDASRLSPPVLLPGNPYPVRLSIRVFVDPAGMPASDFRSSLHTIRESRNDAGGVCVTLAQQERLDRDFVLRWKLVHPETISQLLISPDRDGSWNGTFALTIAPPLPTPGSRRPRDVAFVIDHSASTAGWRLAGTKSALRRLIAALTPSDRMMVLGIGEYCTWPAGFNPTRLAPAGAVEQDAALAFLDQLQSRGGGDLAVPIGYAASTLNAAAALSPSAGTDRERVVVLVAGGRIANEKDVLKQFPVKERRIRVLAVGLDQAVNAEFLQQLAEAGGGGVCELVESPERLEEAMERILHLAIGPVATGLTLHPVDFGPTQVAPARLPPLFADTPLVVFGRYSGSPAAPLEIEGTLPGGGAWRASAAVRPTEHPAVAACWARIRLRELEDRYALGRFGNRSKEDFYAEMVRLSLERQVLCRFTAFAAVDRTGAAVAGSRMRTVVQPVEPVGEPPPSTHASTAPVRRDETQEVPTALPPVGAPSGTASTPRPASGPATAAPVPQAAPPARPTSPPAVPNIPAPSSSRVERQPPAAPTKSTQESPTIAASAAPSNSALPPPAPGSAGARQAAQTPATALPAPPPSAPRPEASPAPTPAALPESTSATLAALMAHASAASPASSSLASSPVPATQPSSTISSFATPTAAVQPAATSMPQGAAAHAAQTGPGAPAKPSFTAPGVAASPATGTIPPSSPTAPASSSAGAAATVPAPPQASAGAPSGSARVQASAASEGSAAPPASVGFVPASVPPKPAAPRPTPAAPAANSAGGVGPATGSGSAAAIPPASAAGGYHHPTPRAAKPASEPPKVMEKPKVEHDGAGAMFRGTFDGAAPASHGAAPPPSASAAPPAASKPAAAPSRTPQPAPPTPPTSIQPPKALVPPAAPAGGPSKAFGTHREEPSLPPVAGGTSLPSEIGFEPPSASLDDSDATPSGTMVGSSSAAASHPPPSSWGKSDGVWRPPAPLAVGDESSSPAAPFGPSPTEWQGRVQESAAAPVQAVWDGTAWVPAGGSGEWYPGTPGVGDPNPYAAAWAAYNQAQQAQWNWGGGVPSAEAYAAWYAQQQAQYPQAAPPWGYYPQGPGGEAYPQGAAGYVPGPPPAAFAQPTAGAALPSAPLAPPVQTVQTPLSGPLASAPGRGSGAFPAPGSTANVPGSAASKPPAEVPPPPSSVLGGPARIRDTALAPQAAPPVADLRSTAVEAPDGVVEDVRGTEPCDPLPPARSTVRRSAAGSRSGKKPRSSPATRAGRGAKGRKQLLRRLEALEWQVRTALLVGGLAAFLALLLLLARLRG